VDFEEFSLVFCLHGWFLGFVNELKKIDGLML